MIKTAVTTQANIKEIFDKQRAYAPQLALTTAKERIAKLDKLLHYLSDDEKIEEVCEAVYKDFKKHPAEVFATEIGLITSNIKFIRSNLSQWMRDHRVSTPLAMVGNISYKRYEPKGNVLIIAPWNYPFQLSILPLIYAIAAGNAVMLKPSELTVHTSAMIKKLLAELYDENEVAVIEGGVEVSTKLLALPFNHTFFTGSPRVGKIVMAAAAKHLTSVTLELGGKSPTVVDETADIKTISGRMAWGKFVNKGQTCIAPDYVMVHESKKEEFIKAFKNAIDKMYDPVGKGIEASEDYCRIINLKNFHRIKNLLDDAINKGAKVEFGGITNEDDLYVAPTVLTNVNDDMAIMQEEIFGPLLPVIEYTHKEEVIEKIKARPKPLAMFICSRKQANIDYFINHTSAGGSMINEFLLSLSNPNLSFGGVNNSGIGKSGGFYSFKNFSNERSIIRRNWATLKMIYPPYTDTVKKMLKTIYKFT